MIGAVGFWGRRTGAFFTFGSHCTTAKMAAQTQDIIRFTHVWQSYAVEAALGA
jgi:hypothetical protein